MKVYEAPKRRRWEVQVEFMDGTVIDAASDADAMERWQRIASWWDETALTNKERWLKRVLDHARSHYAVSLPGIDEKSESVAIFDAMNNEGCLIVRRKS